MSNKGQFPTANDIKMNVKARNAFRAEFDLPPVDLEKELFAAREAREGYAVQRWMNHPIRLRVEQKMLQRLRRRINDPNWKPTGMLSGGGLFFHVRVKEQMRKLRKRLGDN